MTIKAKRASQYQPVDSFVGRPQLRSVLAVGASSISALTHCRWWRWRAEIFIGKHALDAIQTNVTTNSGIHARKILTKQPKPPPMARWVLRGTIWICFIRCKYHRNNPRNQKGKKSEILMEIVNHTAGNNLKYIFQWRLLSSNYF